MRRGTRVGQAYVAVTADGSGINEEIVDSVDEAGPGVERAGEDHGERYGDSFGDGLHGRLGAIRAKLGSALSDRLDTAAAKAGERAGNSLSDRMVDKTRDLGERIGSRLSDQISESLGDRIQDLLASALTEVDDMLDRARSVSGNRGGGGSSAAPSRDLSDRVGGLLGAGSRNNALNLFGKAVGGTISSVMKLQGLATSMFATFQKGWSEAAEGASTFQKFSSGAGAAGTRAMSSLAASGPAAAAAILVVVGAMSVMASVASALTAIITALAASIVSALAGGLLILGGAMAAAAAAAGLLTVAFTSMTDAQSKLLSDAFQPLKAELTGIGQLMITQMIPYFDQWSGNLQEALLLAAPAAAAMGQAFGQAGASLTAALSGPGFQAFANALGVWLPSITQRMSNALGSFLNGLTGVFAALLPFVNRFAGYLQNVAERFSEWANSAQGQNAIVDFTERALDSLQSLWNFVREFGGFLADVLFSPEAQNFGDGMFDGLADSFERLRKRIDSGDLERWFADAAEFGESLWQVVLALADVFAALNNSGVLEATGVGLSMMAGSIETLSLLLTPLIDVVGFQLSNALVAVTDPLQAATNTILAMGDSINFVLDAISKVPKIGSLVPDGLRVPTGGTGGGLIPSLGGGAKGNGLGVLMSNQSPASPSSSFNIPDLISSGNAALNATSVDSGGYKKPKEWKNPYIEWANSLIDEGPSGLEKVRTALREANKTLSKALRESYKEMTETLRSINKDAASTIRDAATADNADSVISALSSLVESSQEAAQNAAESIMASARSTAKTMRAAADSTVEAAQSALNSAASSLASATTPKAAAEALANVRVAEKALDAAEKAADKIDAKATRLIEKAKKDAAKTRAGIDAANLILTAQTRTNSTVVQGLINGDPLAKAFATLSEYAAAREFVAAELEKANAKLGEAMQIRDQYRQQITDSINAFGALTTAQAQVINGVTQALTAGDIVSNLQTRLDKIKAFQDNLRTLLSLGLSDAAYKQILDMGVEGGSAYADALVAGGQGAVSATNDLVGDIGTVADQLGLDASSRLYQAGVDAAQGLVDGLTSLSAELDAAATALGERIAAAVRKALGINSPSRVLMADMDYVGDGAVIGLDNQADKVGRAAARFSDNISVSPEVAAYAAAQRTDTPGVSGNGRDPRFRDLIVQTPTENPEAVAMEVLNEVTGRI